MTFEAVRIVMRGECERDPLLKLPVRKLELDLVLPIEDVRKPQAKSPGTYIVSEVSSML